MDGVKEGKNKRGSSADSENLDKIKISDPKIDCLSSKPKLAHDDKKLSMNSGTSLVNYGSDDDDDD